MTAFRIVTTRTRCTSESQTGCLFDCLIQHRNLSNAVSAALPPHNALCHSVPLMLRRSVVLSRKCQSVLQDTLQRAAAWLTWPHSSLSVTQARFHCTHCAYRKYGSGDHSTMPPSRPSSSAGAAAATSKLPADFGKKIQPIYDAIDSKSAHSPLTNTATVDKRRNMHHRTMS